MRVSRDSYYKHFRRKAKQKQREEVVLKLVKPIRQEQPRLGCRKLYHEVKPQLETQGLELGRDRFFEVLGEYGMHLKPRKKYVKTTYSRHPYAVAVNRLKGLEVVRPNQVFVADITYITVGRTFAYLFLVTDLFSRKIVGYNLSNSLSHDGAVAALDMAAAGVSDTSGIIHHSDRGCQYCCHDFMKSLSAYKMIPSMTDESHCYQNAVAERVNGILKQEFYLDCRFKNFKQAQAVIDDAIRIYNKRRPHWSLNLLTPQQVYAEAA